MAEQNSTTSTATAPDPSKIASAGAPVRVGSLADVKNQKQEAAPAETTAAAPAAATTTEDNGKPKEVPAETTKLPELTDEQLKQIFAAKGIEGFDGNFEALKEKLQKADKPADTPLTEEQKKAAEAALDKRMLDQYIEDGGTAEQYVAFKQIVAMDLRELSLADLKRELKGLGFDDEQQADIIKERYYQLNPDELKQGDDEEDAAFNKRKEALKKKVAAFSGKLENRGLYIKKDAEETLKSLREAISEKDAAQKKEAEFSSKVDEFSKKLPRTITLELGEINNEKIAPVIYSVSEADVAEVTEILKDKAKRESIFFNEDKTLNYTKVMEMLLRNKFLESLAKTSFIEGGNRQVEIFKTRFPASAHDLGVGGSGRMPASEKGRPGVIKSAGKPERVRQNN